MTAAIEYVEAYIAYMLHPFEVSEGTGYDAQPEFYYRTLILTIGFTFLYLTVPMILSTFWSKWYNNLDPQKKKELPTYFISFFHHFVIVPVGWYYIHEDFMMFQSGVPVANDFYSARGTTFMPLGIAFLLADLICCALHDAMNGKPLYLIHHVSTITIAWILRAAGWRGHPLVLTFEYLFALSFFPIRIFNMSLVIYLLHTQGHSLGFGRYAMHPIGMLQYFWFYKILSMLNSRYGPNPTYVETEYSKKIENEKSIEKDVKEITENKKGK